jgi:hypothetical protein
MSAAMPLNAENTTALRKLLEAKDCAVPPKKEHRSLGQLDCF